MPDIKQVMNRLVLVPPVVGRGNAFFVNSAIGADTNSGKSPSKPMATLDAAVDLCTADQGDVIYVAPEHAEDLGADSAVDADVDGISIIGIRRGRLMPTFNATAIAGDFKLAGDRVTVQNCRFTGGVDATTGIVEISGADCALLDCEYRDVTGQATDGITTVDGADRCLIKGLKYFGAAAAGTNAAIAVDGSDDIEICDCYVYGNFAVAAIDFRTTLSARVNLHDLKIWTANAADLCVKDTITSSTGFIGPNLYLMLTDNAANITEAITGATFQHFAPILVCNLAGEQGMAIDKATSTDA